MSSAVIHASRPGGTIVSFGFARALVASIAVHGVLCIVIPLTAGGPGTGRAGSNADSLSVHVHRPGAEIARAPSRVPVSAIADPVPRTPPSAPVKASPQPLARTQTALVVPAPRERASSQGTPLSIDSSVEAPADESPGPSIEAPIESGERALQVAGAYYFPADEVDATARPQGAIHPIAPAGSEAEQGYLVLQVLVNQLGTVDHVQILVSEPEGRFDEGAINAFLAAQYYPALRGGIPVKNRIFVELRIDPDFHALVNQTERRFQYFDPDERAAAVAPIVSR